MVTSQLFGHITGTTSPSSDNPLHREISGKYTPPVYQWMLLQRKPPPIWDVPFTVIYRSCSHRFSR